MAKRKIIRLNIIKSRNKKLKKKIINAFTLTWHILLHKCILQHTHSEQSVYKSQAGWPRCLLHLRKWSVSTLLSHRAAGQTVRTTRGFPSHPNPWNTHRFRLRPRQTGRQTNRHSTHSAPTPPQSATLQKTHFCFSAAGFGTTNA